MQNDCWSRLSGFEKGTKSECEKNDKRKPGVAGTRMMVEHVDRDGNRHTFKFGRKPDGSYVGDNCFLDMYEFAEDGNKPIIKLRLKNKNEKQGAWFAAAALMTRRSTGRRSLLTSPGRLPRGLVMRGLFWFLVAAACVTDVASANVAGTGDWNQGHPAFFVGGSHAWQRRGLIRLRPESAPPSPGFTSSAFTR